MFSILQNLSRYAVKAVQIPFQSAAIIDGSYTLLGGIRTNVREHLPKPREIKRINVHGWKKRMSTPSGRRVIMRRILKGRHVLSHG